jgi:hypothetical protein
MTIVALGIVVFFLGSDGAWSPCISASMLGLRRSVLPGLRYRTALQRRTYTARQRGVWLAVGSAHSPHKGVVDIWSVSLCATIGKYG